MPKLLVGIDGGEETCQRSPIPKGAGPRGNTEYSPGTCPYYRQFPSGNGKSCLVFGKDHRSECAPKAHASIPGITLRTDECIEASKRAGFISKLLIEIAADEETCETVPIIKVKDEPDPWIDNSSGHETLYFPDQVCKFYASFPNGSTWCRIYHQKLFRDSSGFSKRLAPCMAAQRNAEKNGSNG